MGDTNGSGEFKPEPARSLHEVREEDVVDIHRKGAARRLADRKNNENGAQKLKGHASAQDLVKAVMGTSSGNNAELAKKIHGRFDRAGLKQPSVEVRFDNLSLSSMAPAGAAEGLFTVGVDLKVKALTAASTAARITPPLRTMNILQNVSGALLPGRITLLLGPPGGGKSLLMRALCGLPLDRSHGSAPVATSGDITFNGHTLSEFNVRRTARYVDQTDLHNPALTVRETLTFAAMCHGPGYNRSLLKALEKKEEELGITPDPDVAQLMSILHHAEEPSCNVALILQLLSLVDCADTMVGDGVTRGISGGERKRLTSGEVMVGPSKVLFMDEISTGLDSASTFTIVQSLANWAHATDATIVVALLQPEPQVYDQFDDIMLVANGRIPYHGPRENVQSYFSSLGFELPPRKALADFLQELVSPKDQALLRVNRSKLEPHLKFVPAAALAAAFQRSPMHQSTLQRLAAPFPRDQSSPASLMRSRYGVPGWEHLNALFWRERVLLTRNRQQLKYRWAQMAVLGIFVSTAFVRGETTNKDSVRNSLNGVSVMFFSMGYMNFLGLADCAETMMNLPLFWKQKESLFFPAWAYAIPFSVVRLPLTLIEVTAWSLLVYWVVGLATDFGRFMTFWIILVFLQISASAFYRLMGSLLRAIVLGVSVAVISMLLMFMSSGFVLLRPQIPDYWIWMYHYSPLQYALTGLANNELLDEGYEKFLDGDPDRELGRIVLEDYGFRIGSKWRWIAPVTLLAYYVLYVFLTMAALTFLPPPTMPPPAPPPEEEEYKLTSAADSAVDAHEVRLSGRELHEELVKSEKALVFPFEPVSLAFVDLQYFVPSPTGSGELQLLKGIFGVFRPGVLTALMGASGAGKSTLMDCLADRKTAGRITGNVTVNGHPKEPVAFARVMGYCEQFDVHSSGATVEESIRISAELRLDRNIAHAEREDFIKQTLRTVELDSIQDQIVGIPGMFGLSNEQRKRLTIAVELAANPSILFMDEPTSGLDARAAAIVMRVVRSIVDSNRTIVCTIHQPSAEIVLNFDELLLLKRGGSVIFYGALGDECSNLVDYFGAIPGTMPLKQGYNPATWMLEATTQSEEERLGVDFGAIWKERQQASTLAMVDEQVKASKSAKPLQFDTVFSQPRWVQYKLLLLRYIRAYWRNPPYNTTRLILAIISALIFGSFCWDRGSKYDSPEDILAIMGVLFITVMFCGFVNFQLIIPTFAMERPVMWRERASGMYSSHPWIQAIQDIEMPWVTLQVTLFAAVAYPMIGFESSASKFFFYWLVLQISCLTMGLLGQLMVCVTPNLPMAITMGATALGMWFAFSGFMIPKPSIPDWWIWFYYITPPAWSLHAIVADQLGDKTDEILQNDVSSDVERSVAQYLDDEFGYRRSMRWPALAIALAFVVLLRFGVIVSNKFINFHKR